MTGLIELELLHSNQLEDQLQLSALRSLEVMLATLHITMCMHDCTGRAYSWSPFWTWHRYAHYIALHTTGTVQGMQGRGINALAGGLFQRY